MIWTTVADVRVIIDVTFGSNFSGDSATLTDSEIEYFIDEAEDKVKSVLSNYYDVDAVIALTEIPFPLRRYATVLTAHQIYERYTEKNAVNVTAFKFPLQNELDYWFSIISRGDIGLGLSKTTQKVTVTAGSGIERTLTFG